MLLTVPIDSRCPSRQVARDDGIYEGNSDPNCHGGDPDRWPCGLWIGGTDAETEGTWKWTNGFKFSHFNFGGFDPETGNVSGVYPWGNVSSGATDNEPNNYGGYEDCVRLDLEYSDGLWNDVPCGWSAPFVCELALDNSTWRGGFVAQSPSPPPTPPAPPGPPPSSPGLGPGPGGGGDDDDDTGSTGPDPSPPPPPAPFSPEPSPPPPPSPLSPDVELPANPNNIVEWCEARFWPLPDYPDVSLPSTQDTVIEFCDTKYMKLDVAIVLFFVFLFGGAILYLLCRWMYRWNVLRRILAPRLRKKEWDGQGVSGFLDKDGTPYEDNDPEIQMNPVLMHKRDQQKAHKGEKKRGNLGGVPKSGGLARLGVTIKTKEAKPQATKTAQLDELVSCANAPVRADDGSRKSEAVVQDKSSVL